MMNQGLVHVSEDYGPKELSLIDKAGLGVANFLILDDLHTITNPDSSYEAKGLSVASIPPFGKAIKAGNAGIRLVRKSSIVKWISPKKVEKVSGKGTDKTVKGAGVAKKIILNNGSSLDEMAELHAKQVKSNSKWSWLDDFPNSGSLSKQERLAIKEQAIKLGLMGDIPITIIKTSDGKTLRYADFESAGLVRTKIELPKNLWDATDGKQFEWLDEAIGGRPKGTTWHHSEKDSIMELVEFGVHNVTNHNGGRTQNHWAYRPGGR